MRAPDTCLVLKPAGMTFEQAAAIPQAGMLASQGLIDVGRIRRGQSLLLNGAGGGVGTFALQIAKRYEAEITVASGAGKLDMLRAMGAHHAIDYRTEDFTRTGKRYAPDSRHAIDPLAVLCHARALNRGAHT